MRIKPLIVYPMDPLGNKIGGIQTYIKNFVKYSPDDFKIEFIGVTSDRDNRPVGKWQKISVCSKEIDFLPILYIKDENVRTKIPLSLKFTLSLFKYKKQVNCRDKIITYHRIEPSLPLTNIASKKLLVIHNNTTDLLYSPHSEIKWRKFPWLYLQIEKRLIRKIDKIFAVREDVVKFYKKKYPFMAHRFSFLPTWVDLEIFSPFTPSIRLKQKSEFCKKNNCPIDTKLIIFVGRLEGQKDPLMLINTFRYINKIFPQSRLLIVGNGLLRKEIEQRVSQHGLIDFVFFYGNLPQNEVADLLKISDVFLLTSASEGMPISVLEALGCGLPVVSTDVGEVKRVVRNEFSGLICFEREPAIIGDAALRVLKEDKFSAENCILSIQGYTAKRILKRVYNAYYELDKIQ